MQQMILLEKSDLDVVKHGGTLTINAGGAVVMIGYAGKMMKTTANGANHEPHPKLVKTAGGTKYWSKDYKPKIKKSVQCEYCPLKCAPQGIAKHRDWHIRRRDQQKRYSTGKVTR